MSSLSTRRRLIVVFSVALTLLAAGACGQRPEVRKQKALERGEQFLGAGKHNAAIIEFQNALQADKDFVPALHALGRTYARKYWFYDATRELGRARKLAPDSLAIAADFGRALVEVGDWDAAETEAARILAREPASPQGFYIRAGTLLGKAKAQEALAILDALPRGEALPEADPARAEALVRLGRSEQAAEVLRGVLARDPADARSLAGLGAISLGRRNWDEAAQLYGRAKDLRPEDPRIRLGLAAANARLGKVAEAIKELETVSTRARTAGVVQALGLYYLEGNRPVEAIQLLAPVVTQAPQFAQARFLLGLAYLASDSPAQALAELQILDRQMPDDPAIHFRIAQAEAGLGRPRDALARLDAIARPFDRTPEYHVERGRSLVMLGRLAAAQGAATAARRIAPESPQPYLLLGEIRSQQNDARGAREMFARAAALDARYVPARLALGRTLLAEGQTDAALREFEAAVQTDPRSLTAARTKVGALLQQQRVRDAVKFVEAAVKADPRNPGFHTLLASLYTTDRQWDKAAGAYRKELEVSARAVDARMGLANLALIQKRDEEAVFQLQEAVKVRPDLPAAVLLLTSLYSKQGRADLAVPMLEAALRASRKQPTFSLILGDVYLKTGRYEDAVALMTDVLGSSPALTPARLIRAQARLGKGDGAAALKELGEVVRDNPKSAEAHYLLAHAYVGVGRMAESHAAYREAIRLNPQFQAARLELAALSGQPLDEAVQRAQVDDLQEAIKKDPKNVILREALARALFLRGQVGGAQAELRRILDVAPLHLGANFLTARILLQQGKSQEATAYLEAVLRSNPAHVDSHVLLARQLQARGRLPEAVAHLEAALGADPTLLDAKYQLGTLYLQTDRLDDALGIAQELEKAAPRSPDGPLLRGRVLLDQRNPRGALEAFTAALRLKADLSDAHRGVGQAWEQLQQPERAIESYRRAIALNGTDAVALNNLAWVMSETRKDPGQALALATRAAQISPQSPEVLDTLGWIHYRRGAYAEAEKALVKAVERAPQSAPIHYHLGMTYYRLGKKSDAMFTLRRAAQLDPKLAEAEKLQPLIRELGG